MELVKEWFPTGKFRKVDKIFQTDYIYVKELITEIPLAGNVLRKEEMEYHGKFGHTIGMIEHIVLMSRIGFFTYPVV